jgi:hypothetical protein
MQAHWMEHTFPSAETVKEAMKMANKSHKKAEIRVIESELFQIGAKSPTMKV